MREGIRPPQFADKFFRIDFEASPMPVLCLYPIPAPMSPEELQLKVCALERHPRRIDWKALQSLPRVRLKVPLICQIFNWSEEVEWEGIRLADFLEFLKVETHPEGYYAVYSRDGAYFESLSRDEAQDPRVLLAYGLNGRPLPMEHGGPLRLVVPFLQGYKSVKWVEEIRAFRHDPKGIKRLLGQSPSAQLNDDWRKRFGIKLPPGKAGDPPPLSPEPVPASSALSQVTPAAAPAFDKVQGRFASFEQDKISRSASTKRAALCEVVAVLKLGKREATRKALEQIGLPAYTIYEALGRSRQGGLKFKPSNDGSQEEDVAIRFLPKEVFTVLVEASKVPAVVQAIMKANRTGKGQPGDGKIFVMNMEQVFRISTDESGPAAV